MITASAFVRSSESPARLAIDWSEFENHIILNGDGARVWDVELETIVATYDFGTYPYGLPVMTTEVKWSPTANRVAIASIGKLQVWDLETNLPQLDIETDVYGIGMTWSPDGELLAISYENAIKIMDALTGELVQTLVGNQNYISTLEWSGDHLASASLANQETKFVFGTQQHGILTRLFRSNIQFQH